MVVGDLLGVINKDNMIIRLYDKVVKQIKFQDADDFYESRFCSDIVEMEVIGISAEGSSLVIHCKQNEKN